MFRRGGTTLILLTATQMVRADYDRHGRRTQFWMQPRRMDVETPLGLVVESALHFGPRVKGRVWVVSTELWTQTLSLAAGATTGVSDAELRQALAFECEALSGISAMEASLGYRVLDQVQGQRRFWVVQFDRYELDAIAGAVRHAGGRFAGMLHAGGAGAPLTCIPTESAQDAEPPSERAEAIDGAANSERWARLEVWPEQSILVSGDRSDGPMHLEVKPHQPDGDMDELTQFAGHRELLLGSGAANAAVAPESVTLLDPELQDTLGAWADAWAKQLGTNPSAVPIMRPADRPMSAQRRVGVGVAVTLLVLLACVGHWAWHAQQRSALQADLDELIAQQEAVQELVDDVETTSAHVRTLRETIASTQQQFAAISRGIEQSRRRPAEFLRALSHVRPDELVVQHIDFQGGYVSVHGMCADPELAGTFAATLADALEPRGWRVSAPATQARGYGGQAAMWAFQLRLRETGSIPGDDADRDASGHDHAEGRP